MRALSRLSQAHSMGVLRLDRIGWAGPTQLRMDDEVEGEGAFHEQRCVIS